MINEELEKEKQYMEELSLLKFSIETFDKKIEKKKLSIYDVLD